MDDLVLTDVAISADARASAYRWLAGLFAQEMSAGSISVYRSAEGRELLRSLAGFAELAPLVDALGERVAEGRADAVARELAAEFARLFHGVSGRRGATPCASVHTDPSGRIMQGAAGEMQALLAVHGLRRSADMREPPDHLSVQLSLMAHLIDTQDQSAQVDFLQRHILSWLDRFAMRCAEAPRADFYAIAARVTAAFCTADLLRLQEAA